MRGKLTVFLCIVMLLCGCKNSNEPVSKAISIRNKLLEGNGCSFSAKVHADYGEKLYTFKMDCQVDQTGNLTFSVIEPATIHGIAGKVSTVGGAITFDDKILAFPTIADGQVSPVSAPWLLIKTLRSGYIKGCAELDDGFTIDVPILVGKAHEQIIQLYACDDMFVMDVLNDEKTMCTHWHPYDVDMAVKDIAEFMDGKNDYPLEKLPQM